MKIEKEYSINQPLSLVWDSIQDPELLAAILPGCKSLTPLSENKYQAEIEIKIGPVSGSYSSELELSDMRPLEGYNFSVSGIGNKGQMAGVGTIDLEEKDGKTILSFYAEGNVSGILARVGQRLIEAVGKKLVDQGFENFEKKLAATEYA